MFNESSIPKKKNTLSRRGSIRSRSSFGGAMKLNNPVKEMVMVSAKDSLITVSIHLQYRSATFRSNKRFASVKSLSDIRQTCFLPSCNQTSIWLLPVVDGTELGGSGGCSRQGEAENPFGQSVGTANVV